MSHSMRFIAIALIGWIGLRAMSVGLIPGGEAIAFDRDSSRAVLPAVATTIFAPIEPIAPTVLTQPGWPIEGYPHAYPTHDAVPFYAAGRSQAFVQPAGHSAPRHWGPDEAAGFSLAPAAARYAGGTPPLEQWPLAAIARGPGAPTRRAQSTPAEAIRAIPGIDRLSMTAWAMMRREPGAPSLAANGQLGGSQAGTRLLYRFDPRFAASLRTSAPIGGAQRTAEVAAGIRFQPFQRIPVAFTAERRQSFGRDRGESGFAVFAEGGVYDRPILAGFNLDAYLQAGVVGVRDHAAFVDGSATLTRPVWRQFSAGFGMWGGAQPGLARFDIGPRASMKLGRSMRVHVDYRHRLLGKAEPGSGPVVTLAGDF